MNTELYYLTLVSALTALLWVPYILNRIAVRGLVKAVGYSDETPSLAVGAAHDEGACQRGREPRGVRRFGAGRRCGQHDQCSDHRRLHSVFSGTRGARLDLHACYPLDPDTVLRAWILRAGNNRNAAANELAHGARRRERCV